jgi:hypothetical protein
MRVDHQLGEIFDITARYWDAVISHDRSLFILPKASL